MRQVFIINTMTVRANCRCMLYQWLKWKSSGGGTIPAHLGPLSVHVGPLLTVVPPGDH